MDDVIMRCVTDVNCTYSLVPLKPIADSQSEPTSNLSTKSDSSAPDGRRDVSLAKGDSGSSNTRRPNVLDLSPAFPPYPTTPPSMIITPFSTLQSSSDSLPSREITAGSSMNTVGSFRSAFPSMTNDLMTSSMCEEPSHPPLPPRPDHSFTLPRFVKFKDARFVEENVLERLARSYGDKGGRHTEARSRPACLESRHRSSSHSPRTARRRFLFSSQDSGGDERFDASRHHVTDDDLITNSSSSKHGPNYNNYSNNNINNNNGVINNSIKMDYSRLIGKEFDESEENGTCSKSRFSSSGSRSDVPPSSSEPMPNGSPKPGVSVKLLNLLADPFKKLRRSSGNKTPAPQTRSVRVENVSGCSMTPPARFVGETKSKKCSGKKPDSGSLPSLVQSSCIPSS